MIRIQRSEQGDVVAFTLCGRLSAEQLAEVQRVIEDEGAKDIVLDLEGVNLVDHDAVNFLVRCKADGLTLANCPAYIREWMRLGGKRS